MEQIDPRLLASAASAVWFIQVAVDIVKGIIVSPAHRQWALPLCGILLSWAIVAALQVYAGMPKTPENVAGVILAGLVAYSLAATGNALHKAVRPGATREERIAPLLERREILKAGLRARAEDKPAA